MKKVPAYWRWFDEARFGLFIHWGPYAQYGHGEQVLNRDHLDQRAYARAACRWNPSHYDPRTWAALARRAGMRYAVLTTRHHDGYCLWDTRTTDYSSARQAPRRDFVREYVEAFRAEGLRVGLYYSLIDLRLPAWFDGPKKDPAGWRAARTYVFEQVEELLTQYGTVDVLWFDGLWPRTEKEMRSEALVALARRLQPHILINDRLQWPQFSWYWQFGGKGWPKGKKELGDVGTPELHIASSSHHLWESCMVACWRLWGYEAGARWRPTEQLLDNLVECASKGGNLLLNVGPQPDGRIPAPFARRVTEIGRWLKTHGEAIYGSEGGNVTEFVSYGWQTVRGNNLYLFLRFWDGRTEVRVPDLESPVTRATLLTTGQRLGVRREENALVVTGLPRRAPTVLFPVIRLECRGRPRGGEWARERMWNGDPARFARWARTRGTSVWADGKPRCCCCCGS